VPLNANPIDPDSPQIGLSRRDACCDRTWEDSSASWDFSNLRLILNNDSQNDPPDVVSGNKQNPEYILGGINQPLAITLASFTASVTGSGCVDIEWETATEIDTIGFYLWRSTKPDGNYEMIPTSYTRSKAVMETMGANYAFTDCGVDFASRGRYYYKLEEIEIGSKEARHFHGPIGPVMHPAAAAKVDVATAGSKSNTSCFIQSVMYSKQIMTVAPLIPAIPY
jgi:hypothetical protein